MLLLRFPCAHRVQTVTHVAASTRGRGGARSTTAPGAAVEMAAQRASQETDRFRLPPSLCERLASGNVDIPSEAGARKRQRVDAGGEAAVRLWQHTPTHHSASPRDAYKRHCSY